MTMIGKKHTEETKLRQSLAKKGRKFSAEHRTALSTAKKGKPCPTKGIPRPACSGFRHHNWSGGKLPLSCKTCGGKFVVSNYRAMTARYCSKKCKTDDNLGLTTKNERERKSKRYREWRLAVYKRDNHTCQKCGTRGGKLNADHIQPFALFPESRFNIENGRTLCETCHKATETFGRRKIYRSDLVVVTNNI